MLRYSPWWISGPGCVEVVGEYYYQPQIAYAAGDIEDPLDIVPIFVSLVAEMNNPHDQNAVAVFSGDAHVGYMGRGDAHEYQHLILAFQAKGVRAVCHATVHGLPLDEEDEEDWDGFQRISLDVVPARHGTTVMQPLGHNGPSTVLSPDHRADLHWTEHYQQTMGIIVGTMPVRDFSWFVSLRKVTHNPYSLGNHDWIVAEANEGPVGYLPFDESAKYAQLINTYVRSGQTPNCSAETAWNARGFWHTVVCLPAQTAL